MSHTLRLTPDLIFIDRAMPQPLQEQIQTAFVGLILKRNIPAGTGLPSTRGLAKHLGVSRITVTLAYQDLVAQGYIKAQSRSGFVVSEAAPLRRVTGADNPPQKAAIGAHKFQHDFTQRRHISKPADWARYPYPFIYGQSDPQLFDHSAWRDCLRRAHGAREFSGLAGDQMAQDDPLLVDYICQRSLPRRGISANPEEVLITMGAQNALWLAVSVLAQTGITAAAFEEPGYPDIAETLRLAHIPAHAVPVDHQGLDPDQVPDGVGLVFVTPSHHAPTGATMPLKRRRLLLQMADERDMIVIEDDYEYEMSFLAPPTPALKSIDTDGRVIYLGSFSKSLFPGLRLGYLVAPEPFIRQARALRSLILRHPPGHLQRTTAWFLAEGHYDAHVQRRRRAFASRRAEMVGQINHYGLEIAGAPSHGGSALWLRAPDGIATDVLAASLSERGVLIEPGAPFFEFPPQPCNYFRVSYDITSEEIIRSGIRILAEGIHTMIQNHRG